MSDQLWKRFGDGGGRSNVFYHLKQWKEEIIGIGCAAQIVHNALKNACDRMSSFDVECVVIKIYSYSYIHSVRDEDTRKLAT